MTQELKTTGGLLEIDPESLFVVTTYMENGLDIARTCKALSLPETTVLDVIAGPACAGYLQARMGSVLHAQQNKVAETLEHIIAQKLAEANESGMYSSKDIVDIIKVYGELLVKFESVKAKDTSVSIKQQNNIIGGGDALANFMETVGRGGKKKASDIIEGEYENDSE